MRPTGLAGPFDFDSGAQTDLLHLGDCDDAARVIAEQLGWEDELVHLGEAGAAAAGPRKSARVDEEDAPVGLVVAPAGFTWAERLF